MSNANSPKRSMYIALAVGALFLAVIMFQQANNFTSKTFILEVEEKREKKDLQFQNDPESPIPQDKKNSFAGLKYYPPKEKFSLEAAWVTPEEVDTLRLLTTSGKLREFLDAGKLVFELDEKKYQLTAFEYIGTDEQVLFVPFTDETTGQFTYGGGRYLDITIKEGWRLDFNDAYNPYCVYNEDFSCPIPPRENHIDTRILAGELDYK
ncbi:MAG: DUF1684 domain-containing protein [Bacteroidia bacterium]|nr:DUF1684 domain-containing protein [Bacteroidia bacterium]